jgi:DNA-binding transcriptional LysR family regulator
MMSMLNPRRLRLLVELADRGTISAVAEALHFTPSTVSHGLSTLEREVGVALLERSPRSVRLTPAARVLAKEGRAALANLGAAEADAQAHGRLERGQLALATFSSAGTSLAAQALARIRARHPDLELRLLDAEPAESLDRVAAGEIDVAVVYEFPYLPQLTKSGLTKTSLLDDPIEVCLPPELVRGWPERVPIDELRDEAFVAGRLGSPCYELAGAICRRAGFEPQIAFETDDIAFTCALVNAGFGVAIMPRLLLANAPVAIATRALDPAVPPRRIAAVHRTSADRLASVGVALEALAYAAARHREAVAADAVAA